MRNIINNVRKAFNLVSIQATGLNGNSFSDGKIGKMREIAEIYTNAKRANTPLTDIHKKNIVHEIKRLGQQGSIALFTDTASGSKAAVGTRSAVVMAMFIAFVSTDNTKIPPDITQLNETLKFLLDIDYDLIQSNSDTQRYLKEASEFINDGYKSITSYNMSPRSKLHEIFCDMGGSKQISLTSSQRSTSSNYFARTTQDMLLTKSSIMQLAGPTSKKISISVDPEQFVLTLHKYPERFYIDQVDATLIFNKLDSKTRVAITTLIYKHKEYYYLAKTHSYLFDISIYTASRTTTTPDDPPLNDNEKLQVRKNICRNAIYQHYSFNIIKSAVHSESLTTSDKVEEDEKKYLENVINGLKPFADQSKSVADNVVGQVQAVINAPKNTLTIHSFINYIFNETEEVASNTEYSSSSSTSFGSSNQFPQFTNQYATTKNNQNNNNFNNNNLQSISNVTKPAIPGNLLFSNNTLNSTLNNLSNLKPMNPVNDDDDKITLISTTNKEKTANNSSTNNNSKQNLLEL